MNSRSCCNLAQRRRVIKMRRILISFALCMMGGLAGVPRCAAGDAPGWMHALVNVPLPAHDEKTDVVLLYSDRIVTVQSADKIKITVREAYKILRPGGREYGTVSVSYNSRKKITGMRGWCIPAQGKDYEVKDKEAMEISLPKIDGSELVSDVKDKLLRIPAADRETSWGTNTKRKNSHSSCKTLGIFRKRIPFEKRTTRCSFHPAGSTKPRG